MTPSTVHVMWFLPIRLAQVAKPGPQTALVLSRRPDSGHLLSVMRGEGEATAPAMQPLGSDVSTPAWCP